MESIVWFYCLSSRFALYYRAFSTFFIQFTRVDYICPLSFIFQVFRDTFPFHNDSSKEGFMFLSTCVQPKSRGSVTLLDSSTSIPPVVDPNYLHHSWDVRCIVKGLCRICYLLDWGCLVRSSCRLGLSSSRVSMVSLKHCNKRRKWIQIVENRAKWHTLRERIGRWR